MTREHLSRSLSLRLSIRPTGFFFCVLRVAGSLFGWSTTCGWGRLPELSVLDSTSDWPSAFASHASFTTHFSRLSRAASSLRITLCHDQMIPPACVALWNNCQAGWDKQRRKGGQHSGLCAPRLRRRTTWLRVCEGRWKTV